MTQNNEKFTEKVSPVQWPAWWVKCWLERCVRLNISTMEFLSSVLNNITNTTFTPLHDAILSWLKWRWSSGWQYLKKKFQCQSSVQCRGESKVERYCGEGTPALTLLSSTSPLSTCDPLPSHSYVRKSFSGETFSVFLTRDTTKLHFEEKG